MKNLLLLVALSVVPRDARAEDSIVAPTIEVVAPYEDAPDDAPASAFATRVRFDRAQSEGRSVADELESLPSLHVRSLGGLGAYSALSIRGSSAAQVLVLVDGVPLTPASDASVSLADLSIDAFQAADVYRGVAPLALGGFAIGGVVDLRTSGVSRPTAKLTLMAGSYGTARLAVTAPARLGDLRLLARTSVLRSAGDFAFYDDRGTRQNLSDDTVRIRRNNDFLLVDAGVSGRARLGAYRLDFAASLTGREAGVPGLGIFQAEHARTRGLTGLVTAAIERGLAGRASLGARLSARMSASAFSDLANEVGLGIQDRRDHGLFGQLAVPLVVALGEGTVESVLSGSIERYDASDPRSSVGVPSGIVRRVLRLGAAVEQPLRRRSLTVRGAAALDVIDDGYVVTSSFIGDGVRAGGASVRLGPSGSVGLRADVLPWISLRSNATAAQRSPTFEELFGNNGAIQGTPELGPERSLGLDAGAWLSAPGVHVMAGAFVQEVFDLIQFVLTSQRTSRAENLGRARLVGLELGAGWEPLRWLETDLAYGWLSARDLGDRPSERGKRVPGRPEHDLHASARASAGPFGLGADIDLISGNFLDPANHQEVPTRIYLGTSLRFAPAWLPGLSLTLAIHNLLDHIKAEVPLRPAPIGGREAVPQAIGDFGGFPLPGRTIFLTLRLEEPGRRSDDS